jgi:uncharacterized membrane protein
MPAYLVSYGVTLVVMLALDMAWLGTVGAGVYRPRLGDLLLDKPVLGAAALFYLLYGVGVVIFAVVPGLRQDSWLRALGLGALFGLFAYATYDLTNLATVRGWSVLVSVLDIAWGACLTAVAAAAGTAVALRVGAML